MKHPEMSTPESAHQTAARCAERAIARPEGYGGDLKERFSDGNWGRSCQTDTGEEAGARRTKMDR